MAQTTYTDLITPITADTMNDLDRLHYTLLGDPADITALKVSIKAHPRGHIAGLTYSNNVTDAINDIDIAAGEAVDSTSVRLVQLSAITKRMDAAWAVGTNQGGLDTGAVSNALYYIWVITRSDTGVSDVLFSLSVSGPTMPANYDYKRRIGTIYRSGGAIIPIEVTELSGGGIEAMYITSIEDYDTSTVGTTRVSATLTVPPNMGALYRASGFRAGVANVYWLLQRIGELTGAPSFSAVPGLSLVQTSDGQGAAGEFRTRVDPSSQIAVIASQAATDVQIVTCGYIDERTV